MKTLLTFVFLICVSFMYAQEQEAVLSTDRPGNSYSTTILPSNSVQLEYGIGYLEKVHNTFQIRGGTNDKLELKLGGIFSGNRLESMSMGTKFILFNEGPKMPAISGLVVFNFPNEEHLTDSSMFTIPSASLLLQKTFLDNLTILSNIGTSYYSYNEKFNYQYSLYASYMFKNKMMPLIEYYRDFDKTQYGNIGIFYCLRNNLSIDAALYTEINNNFKYNKFEIGISWNISEKDIFETIQNHHKEPINLVLYR